LTLPATFPPSSTKRARAGDQEDLAISADKLLHRKRRTGAAAVCDCLHAIIEPFARERSCNVRFVLVVGLQDLNRLAVDLAAEFFGGHPRRFHRSRPHRGCKYAVHVGEHANADGVALDLGMRRRARENESG
jgi:hypothetical protein